MRHSRENDGGNVHIGGKDGENDHEDARRHNISDFRGESLPSRRFDRYKQCERAVNSMRSAFPFNLKFKQAKDNPVAFQMLDDDFNSTLRQVGANGGVERS